MDTAPRPVGKVRLVDSIVTRVGLANMAVFIVTCLLTLVVTLAVNIWHHVRKDTQTMHIYISNTLNSIDNSLKDMGRVSLMCFSDDRTQQILREHRDYSYLEMLEGERYLQQLYTSLISIRRGITGIYIFDRESLVFHQDNFNPRRTGGAEDFLAMLLEQERMEDNISGCKLFQGELPGFMHYIDKYSGDALYRNCLYLVRPIRSFSPYEVIGHIALITPIQTVHEIIHQYLDDQSFYLLLSGDGKVICARDQGLIGRRLADYDPETARRLESGEDSFVSDLFGARGLVVCQTSGYSGVTLVTARPVSTILAELRGLTVYCVVISLAAACIAAICSWLITRKSLSRVIRFAHDMSNFQKDNLTKRYPVEKMDEVGQLKKSFNYMMDIINDLVLAHYKEQVKLQQSQLTEQRLSMLYLKNQVNPHFLYNTLDMIRIKAALNNDEEVSRMLMQLVAFYRLSTQVDSQLVTLDQEIQMLNAYMKLMEYRYPELRYRCNIDETLLDIRIPNFILQPLIENSLLHGLRDRNYRGMVELTAFRAEDEDGCVHIQIIDNGLGMDPGRLRELNRQAGGEPDALWGEAGGGHIGVRNVQARIRTFYNPGCGVYFEENPDGGVIVTIRLKDTVDNESGIISTHTDGIHNN